MSDLAVRWADLDGCDPFDFGQLLSADELERAARLRFERDRSRFVAARGLLRTLLGEHLGIDAALIEFDYGEHGKPRLRDHAGLRFNLSHSGSLLVLALCEGREVGVDVEAIRDEIAAESIAGRFLPAEIAIEVERLSGSARTEAFFRGWVRQEAYAKARGAGLELVGQSPYPQHWSIVDLDLAPGHAAALAIESDPVLDRGEQPVADIARVVDASAKVGQAVELLSAGTPEPAG